MPPVVPLSGVRQVDVDGLSDGLSSPSPSQ
jgi:hypothetical protein